MEKKVSVQLSLDELSYLISTLEMHEFNNPEEHEDEHKKFLYKMCLNLIKRFRSSGYTNGCADRLERYLLNDYKKLEQV
jgi:hypothetical protein